MVSAKRAAARDLAAVETMNVHHLAFIEEDIIERARCLPLPVDGLEHFLEHMDAYGGKDVLDLGCGTGRIAAYLGSRGKRYTGVDFSERFLREARARVPQGRFVCASMTALPFPSESFDGAFACCSFQYTPKEYAAQLLEGVRMVLRPQGALVVMLPYRGVSYEEVVCFEDGSAMHHSWWDIHEFADALDMAGFLVHDAYAIETQGTSYFIAQRA